MRIDTFQVVPALPENLGGLRELAYNLLWAWDEEIRAVFRRLDRTLWDQTYQNPVLMLGLISQERLQQVSQDDSFMSFYRRAHERLKSYLQERTWWDGLYTQRPLIAYFSAEFGISECLPIYSGGLGVLSGDHVKSASDLGVPLIGVGILYQQGYFRQYLNPDGWQQESYPINDFYNLPVEQVRSTDGTPLRVTVALAGTDVLCQVWRAQVGRRDLLLLDTNLHENSREYRDVTDQLYGGDQETRIRQEIVLGIGGTRALAAMGLVPAVCHMNEGHSAFQSLERIRVLMKNGGLTFREALVVARAGAVFTTHTAVPAGFDLFSPDLIDKYFGAYIREMGVTREEFLGLGRANPKDAAESFNMGVLALRTSAFANGVSQLHGEVSRRLFQKYFPELPHHEVPIGHVTNGINTRNWVSREMATLFDRYLGSEWWRHPGMPSTWAPVEEIPDEELWSTHARRRERLVTVARQRLMRQLERRGASHAEVERARGVLGTRVLTIGFARRFATYKRANLLLQDPERLKRILLNPERPVQIIFAGKAHPRDNEGKEILKAIVSFCQREEVRRNAVFIEDYDLVVARYLVQGVDVWLNTPRRGLEASGTSGMKVLPNGGLNISILDGWWVEGYKAETGWAIGRGEEYQDLAYQNYVESNHLYELLEKDVVPLFYDRGADSLPRGWIGRVKSSMRTLCPRFSTNRMLWEYSEKYYLPAAQYYEDLTRDAFLRGRELARWHKHVESHWPEVAVASVQASQPAVERVGSGYRITSDVKLGAIEPRDVRVEVYFGLLDSERQIMSPKSFGMTLASTLGGGRFRYEGVIPCERSGMHGFTIRVLSAHPDARGATAASQMTWR